MLLAVGVIAMPGPAPIERARVGDAASELVDAAAGVVDWAVRHGHLFEGAALARRCLRAQAGHRVAGMLRLAAEVDARRETETVRAERARSGAAWARQVADLRDRLSAALRDVDADEEAEVVRVAACLDPELPGLASRLAKFELVLLGRHAPVSSATLAAVNRELRPIGAAISGTVDGARRETWPDAFTVRTPHYRLTTDVPLELAAQIATDLERVHAAWEELAREASLAVVPAPGECSVLAFASRPTFDMLGTDGLLKQVCAREPGTVGVYSLRSGEAAAFLPADDQAGRRQLRENLCHEAVHQLLHLRVRGRRDVPAEDLAFSWIEEAVCMHHETVVGSGRVGAGCDDDLREGVYRAQVDDDAWTRVERVARGLFLDAGDYGCAALLAHYFLRGQEGRLRSSFLAALRADLEGGRADRGAVLRVLGDGVKARAGFAAHTEAVHAECGR